jgi:hypothetical protein
MMAGHSSPVPPTGSIAFFDYGTPIGSCAHQPLSAGGGVYSASCTVAYSGLGTRSVTAVYSGDSNFAGSTSGPVTIPVNVDGLIGSPIRSAFAVTPNYTQIKTLAVNAVPNGATILVLCKGKGCPFARRTAAHNKPAGTVNLARKFGKHRLRPGARITIDITRSGWLGRSYTYKIRRNRQPKKTTGCLVPGTTQPAPC